MRRRSTRVLVCLVGAAVFAAACGGDDDTAPETATTDQAGESGNDQADEGDSAADDNADGGDGDASDGDADAGDTGDTGDESDDGTTDAGDAPDEAGDNDDGDDGDDGAGDAAGSDLTCDDIFTMTEMEEWFGEPVELTEETTASIGQLLCTWETIEDLDDLEDLAVSLLLAQVFSGDPVPAASFVDPDIFDDVTMIDGVGDLAFVTGTDGGSYYVLDEPVAGVLSFTEINMGDADAEPMHTAAELDELFRLFHLRITG